jgi:pyruvate/2-oxoglutarate dehydrogenase complex dihydrolipoamide dehydrogenase (E3) component
MSKTIQCAVNPLIGSETAVTGSGALSRGRKQKVIAIVGAGPAGITAALRGNELGFQIKLFESKNKAGGQLLSAENEPFKQDIMDFVRYLLQRLQNSTIDFLPATKVSAATIRDLRPDFLINATGSVPRLPDISGAVPFTVLESRECLQMMGQIHPYREVLVIGGGSVGCELGLALAMKGCQVSIIEQNDEILSDLDPNSSLTLKRQMEHHGIQVRTKTRLRLLDPAGVHTKIHEKPLKAELVVLALGALPNRELDEQLKESEWITGRNYLRTGDADRIGKIYNAVHETYWRVSSFLAGES